MNRDSTHAPTHPGELLRKDVLPSIKKPPTEIAGLRGISSKHLDGILWEQERVDPSRNCAAPLTAYYAQKENGNGNETHHRI